MRELARRVAEALERVVVGHAAIKEGLAVAIASRGHVLLEGVPGTAKTLLANAFAQALDLRFARVQFTPDMLPSDLTGTMALRGGELVFRPGPVFTSFLLADEINRTPPKTQAALLEAMQEGQVTIEGEPHPLPDPFMVVATQNPIEYEGTYPLPEAQLDRFMMKLPVDYPAPEEEARIVMLEHRGVAAPSIESIDPVGAPEEVAAVREEVDATAVGDEVAGYVTELVRRTRELPSVSLGASPRAAVHLLVAARASARLAGRDFVTPDDVARMAKPVLAHRLLLSADAELEGFKAENAVESAVSAVAVPR